MEKEPSEARFYMFIIDDPDFVVKSIADYQAVINTLYRVGLEIIADYPDKIVLPTYRVDNGTEYDR